MVSSKSIFRAYLILNLVFWCHRKGPVRWYPTSPVRVLLPLFTYMTSTTLLRKDHHHTPTHHTLPWGPMGSSLLRQTQRLKVKCQTTQCMQPSNTGLRYLPENRMLWRKRTQSMLPSMFPEHFGFVIAWHAEGNMDGTFYSYVLVSWNSNQPHRRRG